VAQLLGELSSRRGHPEIACRLLVNLVPISTKSSLWIQ